MTVDNHHADPELMVDGGILEFEDESLSSPLLLRGGSAAQQPSSSFLTPETVIEQTLHPDGSIAIKASTMTPHPNGYRDVKIEHFSIPSSKAASVDTTPGSPPPSADYLTRVEYRVLSPGLELEPPNDDASTVYTAPSPHGDNESVASTYTRKKRRRKSSHRTLLLIMGVFVFLAVIIGVAVSRDYGHYHQNSPNSAPDASPDNNPPATPANETAEVIDGDDTHGDKNTTSPSDAIEMLVHYEKFG
mmetsp:Transcript_8450/g.18940  ORF Transcript_8450/g.18940 Transcript_8450/m.18940 type:complete len:246 (+) Transcript_8450:221-958(+)|eukprot:CAMPEP_0172319518 /NCGR_PEP_ID=MMETSP1058-20130122/37872_1 /TAXON_ID=83371 /ORGANISM="Detonula confervacea, Strain CCMP 353" /LENGTH=245 /DNA_ID=CAMNT_0013034579 /DNA_START=160 /DNA_END=897 /DNA_ORIENTATION=+